jgi:predicted AAA+ superfamily ATPase
MLKRKVYSVIEEWKNTKNKECLLIKGARQVGKTFIVDEFSKNYKSYIKLNFIESPDLKDIFEGDISATEIYKKMSLKIPNIEFIENNTLIFLDEIQECPNARTALKFLAIDNKYDVIASRVIIRYKL